MIVLHRSSDEVSNLQDVLARATKMPVLIATQAQRLSPRSVYIGKPDEHLTLMAQEAASLIEGIEHKYRNRTIDGMFDSLALRPRERAVGVVFSGLLDDGSRGLAAIHAAGGITMVLNPGHKPFGMQQNAIDLDGPITFIGSASQIGDAVEEIVRHRSATSGKH